MRPSAKFGLTALIAVLLLSAALSTASARSLSVSNQNFRVVWSRLEFRSSLTVSCRVTLEGSFHSRTIAKVERSLIGAITRIDFHQESCTGGFRRASRPPPWHLTYEGFTGTLPNITSIRLLLSRFQYSVIVNFFGFITCRYGTATDNLTLSATVNAAREVTELTPVSGRNIANLLEGSSGFCPASDTLVSAAGDGQFRLLNSTTRIRVTLI